MIVITGATGQLGRLVIAELLKTEPAASIVAAVRDPARAGDLAASGIQVRQADYSRPESLPPALAGAHKVLLISSNEVGLRATQHQAVIDAAAAAGIELLAYTSILRAPTSTLALAREHQATEQALAQSGVPYALLRNGWYSENYTQSIGAALEHGAVFSCAGNGRLSTAARADYAAAAAAALTRPEQAGKIYELAGDLSFSMPEYAALISELSGKPVVYQDLSEHDYAELLKKVGLPEVLANMIADADAGAARGQLLDEGHQLSDLIGRPTTSIRASIEAALNTMAS